MCSDLISTEQESKVNEESAPVPLSNEFELILFRWSIMVSLYGFFFSNIDIQVVLIIYTG